MIDKWTEEEIIILKNIYPTEGKYGCAKILNRTVSSIIQKACKFNLKYEKFLPYKLEGKKYARITVLYQDGKDKKGQKLWVCKCSCGKLTKICTNRINKEIIKSCGCLSSDKKSLRSSINIKFKKQGRLNILYRIDNINNKKGYREWKCKCDCGRYCIVKTSSLQNGKKTCGNCRMYRNGKQTSATALKLHNMLIDSNYNTTEKHHNYKSKDGKYIDIVIRIKNIKIAIEYDSAAYHKNSMLKDRKRYKLLQNSNWKILIIRSRYKLPKISTIKKRIEKLSSGSNLEIITCKDWYTFKNEYKIY